jgi:hypothetical protein
MNWLKENWRVTLLGVGVLGIGVTLLEVDNLNFFETKNIEQYSTTSHFQQGGLTAGKVEISIGQQERHLDDNLRKELLDYIDQLELNRGYSFKHIVVSSGFDSEPQKLANEIKDFLAVKNKWDTHIVLAAGMQFDSKPDSGTDINFNTNEHPQYPNSLEIIVLDK